MEWNKFAAGSFLFFFCFCCSCRVAGRLRCMPSDNRRRTGFVVEDETRVFCFLWWYVYTEYVRCPCVLCPLLCRCGGCLFFYAGCMTNDWTDSFAGGSVDSVHVSGERAILCNLRVGTYGVVGPGRPPSIPVPLSRMTLCAGSDEGTATANTA